MTQVDLRSTLETVYLKSFDVKVTTRDAIQTKVLRGYTLTTTTSTTLIPTEYVSTSKKINDDYASLIPVLELKIFDLQTSTTTATLDRFSTSTSLLVLVTTEGITRTIADCAVTGSTVSSALTVTFTQLSLTTTTTSSTTSLNLTRTLSSTLTSLLSTLTTTSKTFTFFTTKTNQITDVIARTITRTTRTTITTDLPFTEVNTLILRTTSIVPSFSFVVSYTTTTTIDNRARTTTSFISGFTQTIPTQITVFTTSTILLSATVVEQEFTIVTTIFRVTIDSTSISNAITTIFVPFTTSTTTTFSTSYTELTTSTTSTTSTSYVPTTTFTSGTVTFFEFTSPTVYLTTTTTTSWAFTTTQTFTETTTYSTSTSTSISIVA